MDQLNTSNEIRQDIIRFQHELIARYDRFVPLSEAVSTFIDELKGNQPKRAKMTLKRKWVAN